jgi:hypothetical protein
VNVSGVQNLDQTYSPINQPKLLPAFSARCSPSAIHSGGAAGIEHSP